MDINLWINYSLQITFQSEPISLGIMHTNTQFEEPKANLVPDVWSWPSLTILQEGQAVSKYNQGEKGTHGIKDTWHFFFLILKYNLHALKYINLICLIRWILTTLYILPTINITQNNHPRKFPHAPFQLFPHPKYF